MIDIQENLMNINEKSIRLQASKGKPSKITPTFSEVIHRAIKRHAGLSDWDDDNIAYEVESIVRALKRHGYL